MKWEDSSREEFLTKNELWILLTYDDAYVGIVSISSYISSSGSLALKLRILVSVCVCVCVCVHAHTCAQLCTLCDPTDYSRPGSCLQIPGQGYWSGFLSLLQDIFSTQGLNPHLLYWLVDSLPLAPPGKLRKFNKKVSLVRRLGCEDSGQGRLNSGFTF